MLTIRKVGEQRERKGKVALFPNFLSENIQSKHECDPPLKVHTLHVKCTFMCAIN